MPPFRRGGPNNTRGGRGGARGGGRGGARGGPRLPFTLTEELGLPSQKKKEYSRPYDKQDEARFDRKSQNGSRPSFNGNGNGNGASKRPMPTERTQDRPMKKPKQTSEESSSKPARPLTEKKVLASSDEIFIPAPRTSSGERKKITASTSTALSRMLASQKGGNHKNAAVESDPDSAESEEDNPPAEQGQQKQKSRKTKTHVSDAPLDPSIMDSAFGSGRGKRAEKDEEQEIAWLEWKLGKKGAKKPVAAEEGDESDGLDDLLNFADSVAFGKSSKSKGKGKEVISAFDSEEEDMDGFSVSDEDDDDEGSMMSLGSLEADEDDMMSGGEDEEDAELDGSMDEDEDDDDLAQFDTEDEDGQSEDDELKRNTELNARTAQTSEMADETPATAPAPALPAPAMTTGKYIPPSLRRLQQQQQATAEASTSSESSLAAVKSTETQPKSEQQIKLERKTMGLLNKLSEANIESIIAEVEGLYREWSRNEVTTTLTDMIIKIISDRANLLDSFVILYATFVAALYKLKGADLGGQFLQTAVNRYSTTKEAAMVHSSHQADDTESPEDPGKQPLNILTLISELYNFQVVSCLLIYDLIKGFIDDLGTSGPKGEFAVEGVLRVLRCSGPQLRTDDPTALRDIVALVQDKVSGQETTLSARAKFMIETLTNIKNNKVKNLPGGQGQVAAETTTKMKKFLGGLSRKRQVMAHEPLRVTLNDILAASTKGKWWIVGAAWAGDPVRERERERARQAALKQVAEGKSTGAEIDGDEDDETDLIGLGTGQQEELLKLARKQGMNTDVRRQVFMVMMTSDDFTHACDRLAGLKFTEVQQREFIRVALHCLAIEPTYNPYYALLLSHLTSTSYSHRFTLQYALWDFLRDLGQDEVGGEGTKGDVRGTSGFAGLDEGKGGKALAKVKRVGMGLGWVVSQGGVDLTVFKPVDFTSLQPASKVFFRTMFAHLILGLYTRSPGFTLTAKQRARRGTTELSEDERETIEAIFVKTISAGGMELAQGARYLLTRDMGVSPSDPLQGKDKRKKNKQSVRGKRFERMMDDLDVEDEFYRGIVWEGLGVGEEVLGKMM